MTTQQLTIAVIGAGGKMGMRVSNNLQRSNHTVHYSENSPAGQQRTLDAGRTLTDTPTAVAEADVVVLAVPDVALAPVSAEVVPQLKSGSILLTLDPAAAYANLLYQRDDVEYAVAHPCHPSVFLQRKTEAELNDTFGGIAAAQDVVAALESGNQDKIRIADEVIRVMYAPVVDVHWVTVKQLAYLEPTLVEVVACMVGDLLNDALQETVHTVGVPEPAADRVDRFPADRLSGDLVEVEPGKRRLFFGLTGKIGYRFQQLTRTRADIPQRAACRQLQFAQGHGAHL